MFIYKKVKNKFSFFLGSAKYDNYFTVEAKKLIYN